MDDPIRVRHEFTSTDCADAEVEIDTLQAENAKLRDALESIAEGCGHTRCHAYPWIRLARKALGR